MSPALMNARGDSPESVSLAARVTDLSGKTIGLMGNAKPYAPLFLHEIGELLFQRYGVKEVVNCEKPSSYTPAPPDLLDDLTKKCDAVITAIGD